MKRLFCTVCSDEYTPGLVALVKSLKKHHTIDEDTPFKVIHNSEYCKLSSTSMEELNNHHSFIYQDSCDTAFRLNRNLRIKHPRYNSACMLSLCAFDQPGYDSVIFLDSDLIALKKLEFPSECEFAACADIDTKATRKIIPIGRDVIAKWGINAGLMVIGPKYNNIETLNGLLKIQNEMTVTKLPDQEVINKFFRGKEIRYLPFSYNRQVREHYKNKSRIDPEDHVLHFCGPKPWNEGVPACREIEKIWCDVYRN